MPVILFTSRCSIVQSHSKRGLAIALSFCLRLSARLSVCDVGWLWSRKLKILETNCTYNSQILSLFVGSWPTDRPPTPKGTCGNFGRLEVEWGKWRFTDIAAYISTVGNFPYPTPISAKIWGCSQSIIWSRSMMLRSAERRKVMLIIREIIFEEFQRVWSHSTNVTLTDIQTDNLPWHNRATPRFARCKTAKTCITYTYYGRLLSKTWLIGYAIAYINSVDDMGTLLCPICPQLPVWALRWPGSGVCLWRSWYWVQCRIASQTIVIAQHFMIQCKL